MSSGSSGSSTTVPVPSRSMFCFINFIVVGYFCVAGYVVVRLSCARVGVVARCDVAFSWGGIWRGKSYGLEKVGQQPRLGLIGQGRGPRAL